MTIYLRCCIKPGQFSDERIAEFQAHDRRPCSMFVPVSRVHGDSIDVEECDRRGDLVMVWLPSPILEAAGGGNTVTVLRSQLVYPMETVYDV